MNSFDEFHRKSTLAYNKPLRPVKYDFNLWDRSVGGFMLGAQESVTLTLAHAASKISARRRAEEMGEAPLTREEHEKLYGKDIDFKEGEYKREAELRFGYHINREIHSTKARDQGFWAGLGTGMLGNMAMPLDLALAAVPAQSIFAGAKVATQMKRYGGDIGRVRRAVSMLDNAASKSKLAQRAALVAKDGGKGMTLPWVAKEAAVRGLGEQIVENSFVWAASDYTGRDYGALDFAADTVFGPLLNTAISTRSILRANKAIRAQGKAIHDQAAMTSFIQNGQYASVANRLRLEEYSAELNLAIEGSAEIDTILKKPDTEVTPEDHIKVKDFLIQHEKDIFFSRIKQEIHARQDPHRPVAEVTAETEAQTERIGDALVTGNTTELLPEDLDVIHAAGGETPVELTVGEKPSDRVTYSDGAGPDAKVEMYRAQRDYLKYLRGEITDLVVSGDMGDNFDPATHDPNDPTPVKDTVDPTTPDSKRYVQLREIEEEFLRQVKNGRTDAPAIPEVTIDGEVIAPAREPWHPDSDAIDVVEQKGLPDTKGPEVSVDPPSSPAEFMGRMGYDVPFVEVNNPNARQGGAYSAPTKKFPRGRIKLNINSNRPLIPTAFHEIVHYAGQNNREAYDRMRAIVYGNDKLRKKLFSDKHWKHYNKQDLKRFFAMARKSGLDTNNPEVKKVVYEQADARLEEEYVAWFVAEASKHPEFWTGLKTRDPQFFEALRDWFRGLWVQMVEARAVSRDSLSQKELDAFEELGTIIAQIDKVDGPASSKVPSFKMDSLDEAPKPNSVRVATGTESPTKRGYYGERPMDYKDSDGNSLVPKAGAVYRGVRRYSGYTVGKDGSLTIRPQRDEMFSNNFGGEKGTGSSFTKDPSEAAHYGMMSSSSYMRTLQEESIDPMEQDAAWEVESPIIIEVLPSGVKKLEAQSKEVMEGTESESRLVHDKPVELAPEDYKIYEFDNDMWAEGSHAIGSTWDSPEGVFGSDPAPTPKTDSEVNAAADKLTKGYEGDLKAENARKVAEEEQADKEFKERAGTWHSSTVTDYLNRALESAGSISVKPRLPNMAQVKAISRDGDRTNYVKAREEIDSLRADFIEAFGDAQYGKVFDSYVSNMEWLLFNEQMSSDVFVDDLAGHLQMMRKEMIRRDVEVFESYAGRKATDKDLKEIYATVDDAIFNKGLRSKASKELFATYRKSFDDLMYLQQRVKNQELSPSEAKQEFLLKVKESAEARMVSSIHNTRVRVDTVKRGSKSKKPLKFLKTILDGRARAGVQTHQAGIYEKQRAQISHDQVALRYVVNKHGLLDLFEGVSMVASDGRAMGRFKDKYAAQAEAMEAKNLAEASDIFWRDLTTAISTDTVPPHWEGNAAFKEVVDAIKATADSQNGQLNEMGANISVLKGHLGVAQRWDNRTIQKGGKDNFIKKMQSAVDWRATEKMHGGVINVRVDENGKVVSSDKFDRNMYLENWWKEIEEGKVTDADITPNITGSFSQSRKVALLKGKELDVMKEFSGHKHIGQLYLDQVRYRSEMIAMGKVLGTRPMENFDAIAESLGVGDTPTDAGAGSLARKKHALDYKHMKGTLEYLANTLDNPVDQNMAGVFRKVRQVSDLVFLPMSGVSAITDIPMIVSTLQQQGVKVGTFDRQFWDAYTDKVKRGFGDDRDKMRDFYEGAGAGMDAYMNAAARRIALSDPSDGDMLSKMRDAMFNLNGLNSITRIGQEAYIDLFTRDIARQVEAGKWEPQTISTMESFGISESDMEMFKAAVERTPDGVERLNPQKIENPEVATKFREYMMHFMNDAVLTPDAGAQAMARGMLPAGTWLGEATRTLTQYMSFPLAMTRSTMRRFLLDHNGNFAWTSGQTGVIHALSFVGSMFVMAYFATVFKDLLRGKKPNLLYDMTSFDAARLVTQTGLLGIFETGLDVVSGDLDRAVSPMAGTLGKAAISTSLDEVRRDLKPFAGSAYPLPISAIGKALTQPIAEGMVDEDYRPTTRF